MVHGKSSVKWVLHVKAHTLLYKLEHVIEMLITKQSLHCCWHGAFGESLLLPLSYPCTHEPLHSTFAMHHSTQRLTNAGGKHDVRNEDHYGNVR